MFVIKNEPQQRILEHTHTQSSHKHMCLVAYQMYINIHRKKRGEFPLHTHNSRTQPKIKQKQECLHPRTLPLQCAFVSNSAFRGVTAATCWTVASNVPSCPGRTPAIAVASLRCSTGPRWTASIRGIRIPKAVGAST